MNLEGYGFRSCRWNAAPAAMAGSRRDVLLAEGTEPGLHTKMVTDRGCKKKGVKGNCFEESAPAHSQVLVVLVIPPGAGLSLSSLNLPASHAQIPDPGRLLGQLILVKNSIVISSLWINNSNSYSHKQFFPPSKLSLIFSHWLSNRGLFPFLLISTFFFFF